MTERGTPAAAGGHELMLGASGQGSPQFEQHPDGRDGAVRDSERPQLLGLFKKGGVTDARPSSAPHGCWEMYIRADV